MNVSRLYHMPRNRKFVMLMLEIRIQASHRKTELITFYEVN